MGEVCKGAAVLLLAVVVSAAMAGETTVDASKGGVTFRSGDTSLTLGAYAQFRWALEDREQYDADPEGADGFGEEDGVASSFVIPRARILLSGGVYRPWLKYKFEYELGKTSGGSGSNKIKDAYVDIEKYSMFSVRVGQFKTPFSVQELTSDARQQFAERAITNAQFAPARDVGAMLFGTTSKKFFGYSVGVFNGGGEGNVQDDDSNLFVGRVWLDPWGEYKPSETAVDHLEKPVIHVGLGFRTGEKARGGDTFTPEGEEDPVTIFESPDDQTAYNLEFVFKSARWFATAEYFRMTDERQNPATGSQGDRDSNGYHLQGGFMAVPEKLDVALRYAEVDPNTDADDDRATEVRIGATWFLKKHNFKLLADLGQVAYEQFNSVVYDSATDETRRLVSQDEYKDTVFRLQLQLGF